MTPAAILAGLLVVPIIDQLTKWALRRALAGRSIRLGRLGSVTVSEGAVWLARGHAAWSARGYWAAWLTAAAVVGAIAYSFPGSATFAGLLLGGSFSHLVESTCRGSVTDYIQFTFWPAFNLADAAIVVGAGGFMAVVAWGVF